jgi:LmbE family N-acetylglucosaminyl deacetylase
MSIVISAGRKVLRVLARRLFFPAVEAGWAALFVLLGRVIRNKPKLWSSDGRERVLVIAPHPDDETLGCGATIALHCSAGDTITALIVTDGGRSKAHGLSRAEMISIRADEANAAIAQLGAVEIMQLALPEGEWSEEELGAHLQTIFTDLRPTILYAPSCIDYHPEHIRVAGALAQVLQKQLSTCRSVRVYEVQTPLTASLINLIADTHTTIARKSAALSHYVSQSGSFGWSHREERYISWLFGRKESIEVFWELSPPQYIKLMAAAKSLPGRGSTFRGLSPRPFSDGLAWLVGRKARLSLQRSAFKG